MGYLTRNIAATLSWYLQRVTAILISIGLAVHFWVLHYAIERPVTFEKVQERLMSPGWLLFDLLLLSAVVYHGLNGLFNVLTDYNPSPMRKKIYGWGLTLIGLALVVYGYVIIMPFTQAGGVH